MAAGGEDTSAARHGLAALCEAYWFPLYAYVRRHGYGSEDARDLTQSFFARFIERKDAGAARKERGRFRSFLLASMKHFILNDVDSRRALKRGGGHAHVSIEFEGAEDRYGREPADTRTPEAIYERQWALTVLDRTLRKLRENARLAGKEAEFAALTPYLTPEGGTAAYGDVGRLLGQSEGAVRVAVHRLRRRYKRLLRKEIAATVADGDADDELRYLIAVLGRPDSRL